MTERSDERYWEAAYERYGVSLLGYLRRFAADNWRAEELLQELFERAMRSARRPTGDELQPWLYRIATNLLIDDARKRGRFRFVPFLGDEPAPRAEAETAELVRSALRSIPRDQATVLVLRLHEGFRRDEIARILGVNEETVKSRLARGRRNFVAAYARLDRGLLQ